MHLAILGEQVAARLITFADAARKRDMEPVSFHVGIRQFEALSAWVMSRTDFVRVDRITVSGIPVWRDGREYHMEIEMTGGRDTSQLEKLLQL